MTTFYEILSEIRASSLSEKEKGTRFERLMNCMAQQRRNDGCTRENAKEKRRQMK